VSPSEVIGPDERDRLEAQWNQKFRRGGNGSALISETGLKIDLLKQELGDLAALAEHGATKEDIANAFGVPIAFLTKDTNLANLQASEELHAKMAIAPRLKRRDSKLNERLIPLFDPSGRLFFESDDPVGQNAEFTLKQESQDLEGGVRTINEIRAERGLSPVPWGDTPWLPLTHAPTDFARREDYAARSGRNSNPDRETDR
jgi:phage portal protein BeeE